MNNTEESMYQLQLQMTGHECPMTPITLVVAYSSHIHHLTLIL